MRKGRSSRSSDQIQEARLRGFGLKRGAHMPNEKVSGLR